MITTHGSHYAEGWNHGWINRTDHRGRHVLLANHHCVQPQPPQQGCDLCIEPVSRLDRSRLGRLDGVGGQLESAAGYRRSATAAAEVVTSCSQEIPRTYGK